jgi:hypothetical protein
MGSKNVAGYTYYMKIRETIVFYHKKTPGFFFQKRDFQKMSVFGKLLFYTVLPKKSPPRRK